jgi:hypothetical protein
VRDEGGASEAFFLARIAATLETISRARWVFLVANLTTLIILGANINAYLSWSRHFPGRWVKELQKRTPAASTPVTPLSTARPAEENDPQTRELQELLRASVNHRFETLAITLPIIGLRLSTSDIGIIAAIAMLIVSIWLYYAFRHEQHSVGRLIAEVSEPIVENGRRVAGQLRINSGMLERARQVAFALSSRFLFVTTDREDAVDETTPDDESMRPPVLARVANRALFWSPVWILLVSGVVDLASLFWPSSLMAGPPLWDQLEPRQRQEAGLRIAFVFLLTSGVWTLVRRAKYFAKNTESVYRALTRAIERQTRGRF